MGSAIDAAVTLGPSVESRPAGSAAVVPDGTVPSTRRGLLRLFARHRGGLVGLAIIAVFVFVALMAPWLASFPADEQDLSRALQPPGWPHLFGTDELGRDVFSRVLFGARISLGFAVVIVLMALAPGLTAGMLAGFYGGLLDEVIMRLIDILLAFPGFLLAIAIVSVLGGGKIVNVAIALAIYIVPGFARLTRAAVLAERGREYVEAARALGARDRTIMRRHILPNVLSPLLVQASLRMGTVILLLSGFSFLGLGPKPPTPEWGLMLATGDDYLRTAPYLALFPGTAIMLAVLGFNLIGDALRDALDPHLRNL